MDAEQRRKLLGDDVIAHIRAQVAEAPAPPPEVIDQLRRIFARPAGGRTGGTERRGA